MIKAVVFDFGGVMTTATMPERVRERTRELGIDWRVLETGFGRYRHLLDGGFLTMAEMYDLIWADGGVTVTPEAEAEILAADFASFLEEFRNLRTRDWMRELKAEGYRIGILTNMSPEFAERFPKAYPDFLELADATVISGLEKMFKPQRRIYDLLRERIGLKADELCFVDDVEANCEGARRAGWQALRFGNNGQAERDFRRLAGRPA